MYLCCRARSSKDIDDNDERFRRNGKPAISRLTNEEVSQHQPHISEESCGIGILFRVSEHGDLEIDAFVPGGAAERTGKLRVGDQLVRVDGKVVAGKPASQIAPRVLGPAGSIVELAFRRIQGPAVMTINAAIVREVPPPTAPSPDLHSAHPASNRRAGDTHSNGMAGEQRAHQPPSKVLDGAWKNWPSANTTTSRDVLPVHHNPLVQASCGSAHSPSANGPWPPPWSATETHPRVES